MLSLLLFIITSVVALGLLLLRHINLIKHVAINDKLRYAIKWHGGFNKHVPEFGLPKISWMWYLVLFMYWGMIYYNRHVYDGDLYLIVGSCLLFITSILVCWIEFGAKWWVSFTICRGLPLKHSNCYWTIVDGVISLMLPFYLGVALLMEYQAPFHLTYVFTLTVVYFLTFWLIVTWYRLLAEKYRTDKAYQDILNSGEELRRELEEMESMKLD